jgi:threonine/homoserine/homoserine lactone efflux protein
MNLDFINFNTVWLFAIASFLMVVTPGPAWLYIVSNTNRYGLRAGFTSIIGLETGTLVHISISVLGISAMIAQSPIAFTTIKILGALFLLVLGIQCFYQKTVGNRDWLPHSSKHIFLSGVMLNIFNPKGILFFVAFLPQFIDLEGHQIKHQVAFFGLVFILIALTWGLVLTLLATKISGLNSSKMNLKFLTGTVYILIGLVSLFNTLN